MDGLEVLSLKFLSQLFGYYLFEMLLESGLLLLHLRYLLRYL